MISDREILDAMGSMASDAEAAEMKKILKNRGIEDLEDISDSDFFKLTSEAVRRAKQNKNPRKHSHAPITAKVKGLIGKVKNPALLAAVSRATLFGLAKKQIKRNPPKGAREIYGRLLRIEAQKGRGHVCDAACKKANHCYFHDFSRHARVFGLPDGSLWITDKNSP